MSTWCRDAGVARAARHRRGRSPLANRLVVRRPALGHRHHQRHWQTAERVDRAVLEHRFDRRPKHVQTDHRRYVAGVLLVDRRSGCPLLVGVPALRIELPPVRAGRRPSTPLPPAGRRRSARSRPPSSSSLRRVPPNRHPRAPRPQSSSAGCPPSSRRPSPRGRVQRRRRAAPRRLCRIRLRRGSSARQRQATPCRIPTWVTRTGRAREGPSPGPGSGCGAFARWAPSSTPSHRARGSRGAPAGLWLGLPNRGSGAGRRCPS